MWAGLWSAGSPAHLRNVRCHQLGLLRSCAADVWCGSIVISTCGNMLNVLNVCTFNLSSVWRSFLACIPPTSLPRFRQPRFLGRTSSSGIRVSSSTCGAASLCAQPTSNLQLLIISVLFFRRLYEHAASHDATPPQLCLKPLRHNQTCLCVLLLRPTRTPTILMDPAEHTDTNTPDLLLQRYQESLSRLIWQFQESEQWVGGVNDTLMALAKLLPPVLLSAPAPPPTPPIQQTPGSVRDPAPPALVPFRGELGRCGGLLIQGSLLFQCFPQAFSDSATRIAHVIGSLRLCPMLVCYYVSMLFYFKIHNFLRTLLVLI